MSLKNCPFCGGGDITPVLYCKTYDNAGMCEDCGATCNHWNTRAAPTMKQWEWVERNACHDPLGHVWHCENYNAFMVRDGANWKTRIGNEHICSLPIKEAQAACVAYVEGKLKEWLVP